MIWSKNSFAHIRDIFAKNTAGATIKNPKIALGGSCAILTAVFLISATTKPAMGDTEIANLVPDEYAEPIIETPRFSDYDLRDDDAVNPADHMKTTTLKAGDSLGPLLQKNGVEPNAAYAMTQAFSKSYSPRALRAGQKITLYADASDTVQAISLKPDIAHTVFVERNIDGNYISRKVTAEFAKELVKVDGHIDNSLYLDAGAMGAPDKVIVQFSQIYAHSVDFQRDIREGDAFEMVFEVFRDHKGNVVKGGDLVYTSFSPRGKTASYYLFKNDKGREGYYDKDGKAAKRMLMRTPINGARISSRYGRRKHPVLGYRKMHKGVDFAAPTGTPIMAGGTGVIERSSRYGSYGNYIRIRHSDGYSTAYAHLSKYARGVKKGRRVTQGQIIGYVGATGRVTGAHLHYEILKNGRQINPMVLSTLSGKPLDKNDVPAFKKYVEAMDTKLQTVPVLKVQPKPTTLVAESKLP